jgi:hypothetical protein
MDWIGLNTMILLGSSPGVFQHLPDHLQNLPSCCSNSIPHLGSKMTSSLQALVWVYDDIPFIRHGQLGHEHPI